VTTRPLTRRRYALTVLTWAAAWAMAAVVGVMVGAEDIWSWEDGDAVASVLALRFYSVMSASVVGASLALAGLALQALLRNPLATPYVLGVSGGASLCIILAGLFVSVLWQPVFGFAGALATVAIVYGVAQRRGRLEPYTLLLSGVIINAFYAAGIMLVTSLVRPAERGAIAYWMMGSISRFDPRWWLVGVVGGLAVAGGMLFAVFAKGFNLVAVGEDAAGAMGIRVSRLRVVTFVGASLLTGASVALAGPIGFVGLICPHLLRMLLGADHRRLVPASLFFGAAFLVLADLTARLLEGIGGQAPPVGVLTAMCGGPFFIYLLRARWRRIAQLR